MNVDVGAERIGILEDDLQLRKLMRRYLESQRFVVDEFRSGTQTLDAAASCALDLLLLDLGLPGEDGIEVLQRLRAVSRVPVLIVSGRAETFAITRGLDAGADDYITKPIDLDVLGARVRSILRRAGQGSGPRERRSTLQGLRFGPVTIDVHAQRIVGADTSTSLTERETRLLTLLLHADGKPVSREALTRATVGQAWEISLRSLDVHVSNIRKKLTDAGVTGNPIRTVRTIGYRLINPDTDGDIPADD